MPLINSSFYKRPLYLLNGHFETIVPSAFRKIEDVTYQRERLELKDGDFLDLDWKRSHGNRLVIISHGLEGSSDRHYSKGMARHFFNAGWDALAWNCRSCSGEINRLPRFYHHGATEDLSAVIDHAERKGYSNIVLVGFSMGGSLSLKYIGERAASPVKAVVAFSVPCHLGSSASELDKPGKSFYRNRFLRKLEKKIKAKAELFPDLISARDFDQVTTFEQFDNRYTAPLHGFKDAHDFYTRASSGNYLADIKIPALIVNALNDPFLPPACYPIELTRNHAYVHLETPRHGGHVGFSMRGRVENWMELRALEFIQSVV
jgi:uncharacterized protein